jgi:hypothetical protein
MGDIIITITNITKREHKNDARKNNVEDLHGGHVSDLETPVVDKTASNAWLKAGKLSRNYWIYDSHHGSGYYYQYL